MAAMMNYLLFFFLLFSQLAWAQDLSGDLDYIETQSTLGSPYNVPFYIDLDGNISLISNNLQSVFSVGPLAQTVWTRSVSRYIRPIQAGQFMFAEQGEKLGWVEVKRKRWEIGLGIEAALVSNTFNLGFIPYKGARDVMVRLIENREEETGSIKMPEELIEMKEWRVGDSGLFQRYGGVSMYAGASFSVVNILTAGITIQNLFGLKVKKISDHEVQFSIIEEDLKNRRLQAGIAVANSQFHWLKGKRVTNVYTFDLENPTHQKLYQQALKGRLHIVQQELNQNEQKMNWSGTEKMGFVGIPGVLGRETERAEYDMTYDDERDVMDIKETRNTGLLLPLKNYSRIVYQSESSMILFWFSEMNKAETKDLFKRFLTPGRIMGAKGFDRALPEEKKLGSTQSQMGLSFSREEIESISSEKLDEILEQYKKRCSELDLDCKKDHYFNKVAKKLLNIYGRSWDELRESLGFLLIDEPALIHSFIKSLQAKKKVYFKFLNEKYQSLEGAAAIEY